MRVAIRSRARSCTQSATNPTGGQPTGAGSAGLHPAARQLRRHSGGTYTAEYIVAKVDGNPLFFPIDNDPFSAVRAGRPHRFHQLPLGLYDASGTWPWDLDANGKKILHNFSFTGEFHYWFKYDSSKSYTLDFVGDDDVWVFINKKLAVDLGGIHTPVEGSITLERRRRCQARGHAVGQCVRDRGLPNRTPDHLLVVQADPKRIQRRPDQLCAHLWRRRDRR
jgi:fibro-slime domain-containing protein